MVEPLSRLRVGDFNRILLVLLLIGTIVSVLAVFILQGPDTSPPPADETSKAHLSSYGEDPDTASALPSELYGETFSFEYSPLPDRLKEKIRNLATPSEAVNVLRALDYGYLVPDIRVSEATGIRQIRYSLPPEAAANRYINLALGQHLPTRFGEMLPEGRLAVVSQFPKDTVGALGPFLWVNTDQAAKVLYETDASTVYQSMGYPEILFGEIYIQDPFLGRRLQYRPTDRIGDFVGEELASGVIRWGTPYLYVAKNGSWGLREYPDIPSVGDIAHLMWNFNPVNPKTGLREFTVHWALQKSQVREQEITIQNPQKPQNNVGASLVFRTDKTTGQTDIVVVATYLYLANAQLFRDIIYNTPLPDGSLPDPNQLIVAAGDLHYVSNGKLGPLFSSRERPLVIERRGGRKPVKISGVRNHTGFYLGRKAPPSGPALELKVNAIRSKRLHK